MVERKIVALGIRIRFPAVSPREFNCRVIWLYFLFKNNKGSDEVKIKINQNAGHLKNLTIGKEYLIVMDKGHKCMILDNNGDNYWIMSAFYETVEEEKVELEREVTEERVDIGVSESGDSGGEPRDGEGDEISVSEGSGGLDEERKVVVKKSRKAKRRYKKVDEEDGK